MRLTFGTVFAAALVAMVSLGCDRPPSSGGGTNADMDTPRRDIEVKTPGGVDVNVDRDGVGSSDKPAVDVKVDGDKVDVDVDAAAVRERIQERRAERAAERAAEE